MAWCTRWKAISTIDDDAWTTIQYTDAVFHQASQQWISHADVAEISYTAFTSVASHVRCK